MTMLLHEALHRSGAVMARLASTRVTVCGAGALGANLTETLARMGVGHLRVIDFDRIEERNLSTQPFGRRDIGQHKAKMLAHGLYRQLGARVEPVMDRLTASNAARLLAECDVVVDAFDNSVGRGDVKRAAAELGVPCLHLGMASGYAEAIWNDAYRVPSGAHDDVCDYPLTRTLVLLTVGIGAEALARFVSTGEREAYTLTLGDLTVRPFEV